MSNGSASQIQNIGIDIFDMITIKIQGYPSKKRAFKAFLGLLEPKIDDFTLKASVPPFVSFPILLVLRIDRYTEKNL